MAIEITSITDQRSGLSLTRIARRLQSFCSDRSLSDRRLLFRSLCGLFAIALITGGDSLLRSYKYYSRLIDARLASGYLTSRPGLYAAPRIIQPGQKLSRADLILILRRAGYVESNGSNVWNGNFSVTESGIEIRPGHTNQSRSVIRISSDAHEKISALTANGIALDSFTLEPEVLSNDLSSKAGKRQTVRYSEIPPVLVHAILAIEDHRFFQHPGVGNEVYLGQRGAIAVRGVEEAARIYFGKELKNLSLAEAATVAGMIQGPIRYSPMQNAEAARTRRNLVLEAMARDRWIELEQAAAISKQPVCISPAPNSDNSLAPYFVDFVTRNLDSQFEASPASLRIYTTIDLDLQRLAEAALKRQLDWLDSVYKNRAAKPQAALVALDPKTGNVLAMVGGRDYAKSQLNRATDARRQPGSTFKPFVYAAALEDGMSPVQTFSDSPRDFIYDRDKVYRPANYGGGYSMGDVTMRTGLVKSLNVVTVDVALQTGLARIANLAEKFGLPKPERYPSLALGTKEVTPLELASAYATFVNGGRRVEPKIIASVGEPPAAHLLNNADSQVISPTTAYMITNMLAAAVDHGTARAARDAVRGTAIAGKTGTSRDGWFVGYTPNLVCVVWIGFDDNQQLGLTGAQAALPAWTEFVKAAVELKPELGGRNFECPEGIEFVEIDAENGSLATLSCPHRELIAVTERLAPNVECFLHGNLPDSVGVGNGEVAERDNSNETILAQHSRFSNRTVQENSSSPLTLTRVDIDARGRRTLVNAMR